MTVCVNTLHSKQRRLIGLELHMDRRKSGDGVAGVGARVARQRPQSGSPRFGTATEKTGDQPHTDTLSALRSRLGASGGATAEAPESVRVVMPVDDHAGQVWTMDFASGALIIGGRVPTLAMIVVRHCVCGRIQHAFVNRDDIRNWLEVAQRLQSGVCAYYRQATIVD